MTATTAKGHLNVFHLPYLKLFMEKGWQVHTASNGDEAVPYCHAQFSIPIARSPVRFSNGIALIKLIKLMKKECYDLVICHTPMGGVLTRIAALASNTRPVIYMAHGFHFFEGAPFVNSFIYKSMERFLARFTDCLVTINEEDFRAANKFHLRKGGKLFRTDGIGVDIKRIQNKNVDFYSKRKELGISDEAVVVLNVGEFIERKNQKKAIEAISICKNKSIMLLLCGRGELEEELKTTVKAYNLEGRVIFAGFRKDIYKILKISDIFLFTSFQEGLPVAVMEAMTAGLPVVCSNVRGNKDLIEQNKGGFLCQPEDSKTFSSYLDILAEDSALRKKFGKYNSSKSECYSIERVMAQMEEIYAQALGQKL